MQKISVTETNFKLIFSLFLSHFDFNIYEFKSLLVINLKHELNFFYLTPIVYS